MAKLEALARRRRAVLRLFVHDSSSEVNRSSGDAQVVSHHRYLVVFHPFVEQLTVFHTSELVLRRLLSSSLGPRSPCHRAIRDGILNGRCQKVRKLCINPYISIVNPLPTDIHLGPTSARCACTIMSLTLHCKNAKVVLTQFGYITFLLIVCIIKHSEVPLAALDSKQIKHLIWFSRSLVNVMGE